MNMYEMFKAENEISESEKDWLNWKSRVVSLLWGKEFNDDFFYALYSDGCTPEYAVAEWTGVF